MFAPPLYSTSGTRVSRGSLPAVRILFLLAVLYASGVNSAETGERAKGKTVAAPVKQTVLVMFPLIDQLALQRFSIPLSTLPPDSIIKNKQYSAWELHRTQVIAVLVVFSVLLLLVAFLVIVTRRLNASRLALIRLNADLETKVQERTAALSQINHSLESEITERKLADHQLRQSEQRFQALFDRAPEGILIIEATTGALVLVNAAFAAMQGYTVAEMERMRLADLDTPETSRKVPERMRRVLAGETITFEVEQYHKAGHIIPLEVTASLITHQGKLLVQAFHRDIAARRQTEAVLHASLAEKPCCSRKFTIG